jgi:hypothetical protein
MQIASIKDSKTPNLFFQFIVTGLILG